MKAELVPSDGGPPIPITRAVTVVGRREFCDVQVDHPSLSKRHCILVRTDGLLILRDLAATNGTKVNGQKVSWAALLPNDRLTLGRCKYKVYLGSDDAPSPSERRPSTPNSSSAVPPAPRLSASAPAPASPAPARNGPVGSDTDEDVIDLIDADDLLVDDLRGMDGLVLLDED